ncbi:unnamed protein product [Prunus armeniaca]|uniref:Uncharacterized protein n=1 Tax=Prunus armeniaca TaxID=36596 RepID=A0A6J5Y735_PRUAR|nr:unnamed protein product [Prunus armeniaca]
MLKGTRKQICPNAQLQGPRISASAPKLSRSLAPKFVKMIQRPRVPSSTKVLKAPSNLCRAEMLPAPSGSG